MNTLKQKLNGTNGMLAQIRYYVSADTLKRIYYGFFDSYMLIYETCMSNLGSESQ